MDQLHAAVHCNKPTLQVWYRNGGVSMKANRFAGAVALTVAMALPTMARSADRSDTPPARLLSRAIVQTAAQVPVGSTAASYEGQIAATLDKSGQNCPIVRNAIAIALTQGLPVGARTALAALRNTLQRCGTGTGAVGGNGNAALANGPSFNVTGGGSDYRR